MSLKKIKTLIIFITIILFVANKSVLANETIINKAIDYLGNIKFFSASFIQSDNETVSEGRLFIGSERIRVEYSKPSKILIILDSDKAMYYNYELDEDEFFNPKKTSAWFFYDTFKNAELIKKSKFEKKDNNLIIYQQGENQLGNYKINVFFENNPMIIRKIVLLIDDTKLILSFFDHKYNETFDKNFFKLINPTLLN